MARRSLLDEHWEHLLRLEALCQHEGLTPNAAAERIVYRVPGAATRQSKKRLLQKYHAENRNRLQLELELGRQQPLTLGAVDELRLFFSGLKMALKAWPDSDTAKQLQQFGREFECAQREWAIELDVLRAIYSRRLAAAESKNHKLAAG